MEFPSAFASFGRVRSIAVARETVGWAFLSAVGAGFFAGVCVELLLLAVYPVLFPATREQPIVLPARDVWEASTALAAGAVAMRAGGIRAALSYVVFELALVAAQMPARVFSCSRAQQLTNGIPPGFPSPCDYATLITGRWYFWVALAVGVVMARAIATRHGTNTVLRAAGVLGVAIAATQSLALAVVYTFFAPTLESRAVSLVPSLNGFFIGVTDLPVYALAIGELVGGVFAGALVARRGLAAPLVIALVLTAPSLIPGVVLWRSQTGMPPYEPIGLWLPRMSWLWIPLLGSLALFASWTVARWRPGTVRLSPQ